MSAQRRQCGHCIPNLILVLIPKAVETDVLSRGCIDVQASFAFSDACIALQHPTESKMTAIA